jgi:hypothetical protein
MKKIFFTLYSKLSMSDTIKRIADLLVHEHVNFYTNPNSLRSTHVPFPIVSIDKRMFTRKNWVGLNPFIYISSIEIFFRELNIKETQIDVRIDQCRAIVMYLSSLGLMLLVALAIPVLWVGIAFFVSIAILTHLFIFSFCIKRLIKSEILKEISEGN